MSPRATTGPAEDDHVIVVDLGYGDAGKGTVVDWLCARPGAEPVRPRTVIRFNGGAQAAHNVVTPDGRHHTFAQFGSGMFTAGVRTHLSRFMLVDPLALAAEAAHLAESGVRDALDRLTVDRDALLTTPYHRAANRARELARPAVERHGSCGMGIGETMRYALDSPADAPRAGDCDAPRTLARKLRLLRDWLAAELGDGGSGPERAVAGDPLLPSIADLADAYRAFSSRVALVDGEYLRRLLHAGPAVFEGAQGVLLDEWHGFHPYTTWSTTTFASAQELLAEAGMTAFRLGVTRCYLTRHGPGPLVTQDPTLELPERHNARNRWQGRFRLGHFDAVALRYAVEAAGGVDGIGLTHLDVAEHARLRVCDGYLLGDQRLDRLEVSQDRDLARQEQLTRALLRCRPQYLAQPGDWPTFVAQTLGAPVVLLSTGPTSLDKAAAGAWRTARSGSPPAATASGRR
ncbi:MAG TPA: adenylosuccinate synthetase [Streptosporangiaceae bacterium]